MNLLQQVIQLLSESPGNVIYHLVTLFALQAVFAIALSQWRRDRTNQRARRMSWAAAAIFVTRAGLMIASLSLNGNPVTAVTILPPLEQAIHTVTAVLITWALIPHPTRWPRLSDTLVLIILMVIGVMYFFFAQGWPEMALSGDPYNGSRQATVWGLFQVVVLAIGLILTAGARRLRFSLHSIVIGLLLLAHMAHFWNYPEIIATDTHIAYWIRLGHLIVFPLWAVLAYRHSLEPLLAAQQANRPSVQQLVDSLQLSTQVINSLDSDQAVREAIAMVATTVDAVFVGIATANQADKQQLHLTSNQPQTIQNQPRSWNLNLADWPAFRLAIEQKQGVELVPDGLGARQLHEWYEEIGTGPLGAMLVEPLLVNGLFIGFLLLARPEGRNRWSERDKVVAPALARFVAQAIANSHTHAQTVNQALARPLLPAQPDTAVSGRVIALEEERDQLLGELEIANSRLIQAKARMAASEKKARDLAAAIEELERLSRDDKIAELETEIETLRESLIEAEEAMALASAGEGGLSTEWVMLTITRYSGQLEAAQERIQSLEAEVTRRDQGMAGEVVSALVQELRTPMTSIAGYTDLLLGETIGILGVKQRDFLQRVKANTERMGTLLGQIVQLTTVTEQPHLPDEELVDAQEVIETAATTIINQIREKNLRLDLDIAGDLPPLPVGRDALHQIITNLLDNACQSSDSNGRISLSARTNAITTSSANGESEIVSFMQLDVTDSGGGISVDDRARVFDPQYRADNPLIAGLGDTGAGLSVAHTLTEANGGRIWVDSELGRGSTFSVLFPIVAPETAAPTTGEPEEGAD